LLATKASIVQNQEDGEEAAADVVTMPNVAGASESNADLPKVVSHIGERIGELSINVADMSGTVGDVSGALSNQLAAFQQVSDGVSYIADQNELISNLASEASAIAKDVGSGLGDTSSAVETSFAHSVNDIKTMATSSEETYVEFQDVKAKLTEVANFSQSVLRISSETQFLAINAGIMAANSGEVGKGFAIIAESIRELAMETSSVSKNIVSQLDSLNKTFEHLLSNTQINRDTASDAVSRTDEVESQLAQFRKFNEQVSTMAKHVLEISGPIEKNTATCIEVAKNARNLNQETGQNSQALSATFDKFNNLVSFTEDMILLVEQSGVETKDTPIIQLSVEKANLISQIFTDAISEGTISQTALFDEDYKEITGTDPVQYNTSFADFTDRALTPILEAVRDSHPRIVFAAAVDRNGYLPTHNVIYSQPQSADPVWNAANCRNRRIFNDRTGLAAGQNTKPFVMQTYRRDMGGGEFALMKDLSAPILVNGRHWGGLRLGLTL